MNKKLKIGIGMSGAGAILAIGFGLYTYFSAPKFEYTKPSEIIQEVVQERKENSQLEKQVKEHIKNLNNQMNRETINNLFLYECDLSKEQREQYTNEIQKQKYVFEFEYLLKKDKYNLVIGLTVNGEPTYLYGTSLEDLHFKCDF